MKKWLEKYNDGGPIQENYNDSKTSLPEGFVGMGNDITGRNYSPAWGGQFQMGGSIDPMIQQRIDYTNSPLFKQRLQGQGIKNVDETIASTLSNLQGTQFEKVNPNYSQAQTTTRGGKQVVSLKPQDDRYTKAHEIGHAMRGGENIVFTRNPNITKEGQLSPAESWQFYNRNAYLAKPTTESVYDSKTGKMIQKDTTFKNKVYNEFNTADGYYSNDAAVTRLKSPTSDPHDYSSREGYGDLSAVRQILLDNKITKSYGENVTPEQWQKALQNKKISGEQDIQRAIKNYGHKGIVDLNNTVAYQNNNDSLDQAQFGTSLPGATGMMYARIGAPSNGPYAKKTKASAKNGAMVSDYYINGLDFKTKGMNKGGAIQDDRGQWAHPGEVTDINSPNITMQGVDYPVLGISKQTGEKKLMLPNNNYTFDNTNSVREVPWLEKYNK